MTDNIIQFRKRRPLARVRVFKWSSFENGWAVDSEQLNNTWIGFYSYEEAIALAREITADPEKARREIAAGLENA
jgi:hypothetical protein